MPVILALEDYGLWLVPDWREVELLLLLLEPLVGAISRGTALAGVLGLGVARVADVEVIFVERQLVAVKYPAFLARAA